MSILTLGLVVLDESYPPPLLVYKARMLGIKTGNRALHAKPEAWDPTTKEMVETFGV